MKRKITIFLAIIAIIAAALFIYRNYILANRGYDWDESRQLAYAHELYNEKKFDSHAAGLYRILAEKGNPEGMFMYGMYLRQIKKKDAWTTLEDIHSQGLTWLMRAAKAGYAPAQFRIGMHYFNFDRKNTLGIEMLRAAAEQAEPNAELMLGIACLEGYVDDGINEGIRLIRRAAGQGDPEAARTLGVILLNGDFGIEKNQTEATKWLRRSAENGNLQAQEILGSCYLKGQGVAKDTELGLKWLRKAAENEEAYYGSSRIRTQYGLN